MKKKRRKPPAKKASRRRKINLRASADDGGTSREKEWLRGIEGLFRPIKKPVTLRLDADVLAWFKRQGQGYQTRINRALRAVMMKERKAGG
jgi:uncharacterized protein (DUF4415 family)